MYTSQSTPQRRRFLIPKLINFSHNIFLKKPNGKFLVPKIKDFHIIFIKKTNMVFFWSQK